MPVKPFNTAEIKRELKAHAKALDIPPGAANAFIDETVVAAAKHLERKKLITAGDLDRALIKELKKYHADLAYVYENRDKII